jgi:glucose/arabinose dehydrogenase
LRRVVDGQLLSEPISGLPNIASIGQGGLLDIALHPDFDQNQRVYLSYAAGENRRYGTEVMYGKLNGNKLEDVQVIFKALPKTSGGRHFGSRLTFDQDGYLYISLGDRGDIPVSNPFVNQIGALPEIYSYGHRNVQGMAIDPETNTLWAHEHGPQGGDELNRVLSGQNYGWPIITFGVNYGIGTQIGIGSEKDGMMQPTTYWDPSIAPSGLAVINSERYPNWQSNLMVGALKFQLLARLEIEGLEVTHEERLLAGELGRIRDVRQGPDGYLYLLTDSDNGKVFRLE